MRIYALTTYFRGDKLINCVSMVICAYSLFFQAAKCCFTMFWVSFLRKMAIISRNDV